MCVRGAAFTPGQWAGNFATGLATWWDPQDGSIYKHEHPPLPQGVTPEGLAAKAERVLASNTTARAFTDALVNQPNAFKAPDAQGKLSTYSKVMVVDHKESGFSGAIYMNENGVGMARVASRVPAPAGSAAVALEVFTREKIGVEGESLADSFLLSVLRGRLKENVVHFRTITEAAKALREDSIAAIMAPRGELEGALAGDTRFVIDEAKLGELNPKGWPVGMAVKAESADLAAALSGALAELQKDGTVAAIFKKHGVTLQTH